MESYLTISDLADAGVKFRLSSLGSLTGPARITEPTAARTAQMIGQISWRNAGLMPVSTLAATQHQDGHFADGGCDVTDTKFATRLGPPSCSPPV